jgi:ribonuclease HIII
MQDTRVLELAAPARAALRAQLERLLPADAEWRPAPYAVFQVKADGVVATLYQSGKLVVQGSHLEDWLRRYLPGIEAKGKAERGELPLDQPTIGSDEVGKGDYFGPLVVAAVFAEPGAPAEQLARLGVADSKTLSDVRVQLLAGQIERGFDHAIVALPPAEYNECWRALRNVNHVLAELHARAIATLLARHPGAMVLVDEFAAEGVVRKALAAAGAAPGTLVVRPRAEAHPAVAAASILARAEFLAGLQRCTEQAATDLHKGAGAPVDAAAARVFRIGGRELLGRVAKLHFANTRRIPGAGSG